MAEPDKRPVTMEELLVTSLAQTDALAKLLIEKGLITRKEFMEQISEERGTYQKDAEPDATVKEGLNVVIMARFRTHSAEGEYPRFDRWQYVESFDAQDDD
jgi:hypothetical protein